MESIQSVNILLVDDHPLLLEGIRSCLISRPGFRVVGEARNGVEALEQSLQLSPSVIVMDINMPLMNGLEATRHLRLSVPEAKVLLFSMHDQRELASQIIESGARGFVSKNSSAADLVRAIELVHRGDTFFGPLLSDCLLRACCHTVDPNEPKPAGLSIREREVLTLIADGFSNKEAAGVLGVSIRTVEKHRERIMDKLNLRSVVDLTKYAIANQLVRME